MRAVMLLMIMTALMITMTMSIPTMRVLLDDVPPG